MRAIHAVLGLAALAAGCATAAHAPSAPRDADTVQAELALEHQVERRLGEVFGDDADNVRVAMDGDKALLLGSVHQRAVQELATEVALSVEGVRSVSNRLRLVRAQPAGIVAEVAADAESEAKDAGLESEVKVRLLGEVGRWAGSIEVEAVDGVVSLRGRVPDEARRDIALRTARDTRGVRRVIDLLRVSPAS